jgi:hypothetical protein
VTRIDERDLVLIDNELPDVDPQSGNNMEDGPMTKIDDKQLENISGAGGNQDVEPEMGRHEKGSSSETKPPEAGGSTGLDSEGSGAGGTQNLQQ